MIESKEHGYHEGGLVRKINPTNEQPSETQVGKSRTLAAFAATVSKRAGLENVTANWLFQTGAIMGYLEKSESQITDAGQTSGFFKLQTETTPLTGMTQTMHWVVVTPKGVEMFLEKIGEIADFEFDDAAIKSIVNDDGSPLVAHYAGGKIRRITRSPELNAEEA